MAEKKTKPKKGKKKFQIELTSLSISLWSFCLFFLLAWVFVLGILVGRGFLPDAVTAFTELKGQIAKLQEMVGHRKSQDVRSQKRSEPDPKLAFYKNLTSKKDEAKKRVGQENNANVPKKAPLQKEIEPSPNTMPAEKKKENTEISRIKSALLNSETQYTVQLASLGEKANAERMMGQLIEQGFPAYFYEVKVNGQSRYRVRSGRFMNREEAKAHADKLAKKTGIKGFVSKVE